MPVDHLYGILEKTELQVHKENHWLLALMWVGKGIVYQSMRELSEVTGMLTVLIVVVIK